MNKFENLDAWKEAHKLVLMVYGITKTLPKNEIYRLTDQICRSTMSVAANLVEGNARGSKKEYKHFALQARGSLEESKYHLLVMKDLGYINDKLYNDIMEQANKTGMLINGLIRHLKLKIGD